MSEINNGDMPRSATSVTQSQIDNLFDGMVLGEEGSTLEMLQAVRDLASLGLAVENARYWSARPTIPLSEKANVPHQPGCASYSAPEGTVRQPDCDCALSERGDKKQHPWERTSLPPEPTRAMLDAWTDEMRGTATHRPSEVWPGLHYSDSESLMVNAYQAMLSAAPEQSRVTNTRSFSDFIRNATPEEKEAIYTEVMQAASERQRGIMSASDFRLLTEAQKYGAYATLARSSSSSVGGVVLLGGKPHRLCECSSNTAHCPRGRERKCPTAGYDRCLIPALDVIVGEGVTISVGAISASSQWQPVSATPPDEDRLFVVRDADGQYAFAVRYQGKWEHTADSDCGPIAEWFPLPRAADRSKS